MSNVKEGIQIAIENVKSAAGNTYGAKVYTFDQVQMILQDLLETANEESEGNSPGVITKDDIDELVEAIEERIDSNINDISDSDIIDEDSLEASISRGRISIESLDVDKDNIISEAQYNMLQTVLEWAYDKKLLIEG